MLSERTVQISIVMGAAAAVLSRYWGTHLDSETLETLQGTDDRSQRVAVLTSQLLSEKAIQASSERRIEDLLVRGDTKRYLPALC
jgi:hypothetical protein